MAICPKKVRKKILYYVLYCKKSNCLIFFEQKKKIEQKTFVPKTLGS